MTQEFVFAHILGDQLGRITARREIFEMRSAIRESRDDPGVVEELFDPLEPDIELRNLEARLQLV